MLPAGTQEKAGNKEGRKTHVLEAVDKLVGQVEQGEGRVREVVLHLPVRGHLEHDAVCNWTQLAYREAELFFQQTLLDTVCCGRSQISGFSSMLQKN